MGAFTSPGAWAAAETCAVRLSGVGPISTVKAPQAGEELGWGGETGMALGSLAAGVMIRKLVT